MHKPTGVDDASHFRIKGTHTHAGDARNVGKKRVMSKLKTLAKDTNLTTHSIIAKSIQGAKKATLASLPNSKQLAKTVQRHRKSGFMKNPRELSELHLPEEFCQTIEKKKFLLYDSGIEEGIQERMLIFATDDNLRFLSQCDQIYMDGTFSITPPLFSQVYILHGIYAEINVFNVQKIEICAIIFLLCAIKVAKMILLFHWFTFWPPISDRQLMKKYLKRFLTLSLALIRPISCWTSRWRQSMR